MANSSPTATIGALLVVLVAIACAGVIALGFVMPERLFDSTIGLVGFFVASALMIGCAIVANVYDLRAILSDAFGP